MFSVLATRKNFMNIQSNDDCDLDDSDDDTMDASNDDPLILEPPGSKSKTCNLEARRKIESYLEEKYLTRELKDIFEDDFEW